SSGDIIVSHFAVNYHNEAQRLGIDLNELYSALLADGDVNPPEWNIEGRQVNVYKNAEVMPGNSATFLLRCWTSQAQADKRGKEVAHL
ncbi:hypothetical protein H0H93_002246, partial [Arthromyces matolae]